MFLHLTTVQAELDCILIDSQICMKVESVERARSAKPFYMKCLPNLGGNRIVMSQITNFLSWFRRRAECIRELTLWFSKPIDSCFGEHISKHKIYRIKMHFQSISLQKYFEALKNN